VREIITCYAGSENKVGAQGDVLIPFPGRISQAAYNFDGVSYKMEANDKDGPNAIHGFVRAVPWTVLDASEKSAHFRTDIDPQSHAGYPFALRAEVVYTLTETGLTCEYRLTNIGSTNAPAAAGFHPYFSVGDSSIDDWTLELPMGDVLEFVNLIPTGRTMPVDGGKFDFRTPRRIGSTVLDNCFVNPIRGSDGLLRIRLTNSDGVSLTVWADGSMNYIVVFSGETLPASHRRRSLAIEPMTCGSDAFNHPEWGLLTLKPGESAAGAWGVTG
jgi:aldose 1-epimerase